MTIDTISGLHRLMALISHCVNAIEASAAWGVTTIKWRIVRQRTRKRLLRLDDHQLRDIGVTRKQADAEATRSFWD